MACPSFMADGQPMMSLCDRLKQRYENRQQNWQSLFQGQIQEKNVREVEFIRYIVNTIIEQAKHNIVISELPDVIRTLHCEAEALIRQNRMITLEEAIAQVQLIGAKKYPYLKKVKPVNTADFIKEVMREVFNRAGTMVTLDMIENICQFTTCSVQQLLDAMPAIDVNEAASLVVEDILRNQYANGQNATERSAIKETSTLAASPSMRSATSRKFKEPQESPSLAGKDWRIFEGDSLKSMRNSNRAHTKTKLSNTRDKHRQNWSNNQMQNESTDPSTACDKGIGKERAPGPASSVRSEERPSMNTRSTLNTNAKAPSLKEVSPKSRSLVLEAMRHHTKHRHQYYHFSDNDELMTESETESCSLGAVFRHRFLRCSNRNVISP